MRITEEERIAAEMRLADERKHTPRAIQARYDRQASRIVVTLNNGLELSFPPHLAEGLGGASPDELADIEISPLGEGLHWPKIDADLHVPSLLGGVFGSRAWMARQLGASGGKSRSSVKAAAARENGKKGGRPRKKALARSPSGPRSLP